MTQTFNTLSTSDNKADFPATYNNMRSALLSSHAGSSRPSYAAAGTLWFNSSTNKLYFYDGASDIELTTFDLSAHIAQLPVGGGVASVASAATTDLGGVSPSALTITGTTNITSFGTSMLAGRVKFLSFSGVLTLTHNATSLILPGGANITTAAGDTAIVRCESRGNYRVLSYTRAATSVDNSGSGVRGAYSNLLLSATGLNANVSITADEISLRNASNQYYTARNVSLTLSLATSGANGLDTGSVAASTPYFVYVIWNGATLAALGSLSATSPTLPSGYTYYARVGALFTDGSANKYPLAFKKRNASFQYTPASGANLTAYPQIGGTTSTVAWSALSISAYVPSTAAKGTFIGKVVYNGSGGGANLYAGPNNGSTPYPMILDTTGVGPVSVTRTDTQTWVLEDTTQVYWYAGIGNGGAYLHVMGFEDSV